MPPSKRHREWENVRYGLAGLAAWLPAILAKDLINQYVPASLETPLLVVVLTSSCLLALAGLPQAIDKSRPNRSAFLRGVGGGGVFFSLSIALLQKGLGQFCGVFLAFWIVMMATTSEMGL